MSEFRRMINQNKPVLVDFFAEWCGPCKTMAPVLGEVKKQAGESLHILKVDVDKNPHAAVEYAVRGVPTLHLIKNGQVKWRRTGVVSSGELLEIIRRHI